MRCLPILLVFMFVWSFNYGQSTTVVYKTAAPTPQQIVENNKYFDEIENLSKYISVDPASIDLSDPDKYILDTEALGMDMEEMENFISSFRLDTNYKLSINSEKSRIIIQVLDTKKISINDLVHNILWSNNYR